MLFLEFIFTLSIVYVIFNFIWWLLIKTPVNLLTSFKINKELNVLSNNSSEGLQENNDESLNISSNVNSESSQNNEILSTNNSPTSLNESINALKCM